MNADAPTVLVLDDEELLRESLAFYLETSGFVVAQAASGEEALDVLAATPCQGAVVDIRLPGMTGLEFIAKAHAVWPGMQFLIYTGSQGVRLGAEILAAGVSPDNVFAKPVEDLRLLAEALRRILDTP